MKIGLLFGSFDPIHIGHINIASCVLNSNLCDKVLFVVAQHNPWKKNTPTPFQVRCEMVNSSIEPFLEKCEVCDVEKNIEPPTYSYKTLEKLCNEYLEDELFLICGSDTVEALPNWKNFETHIKNKIGLIEIERNKTKELIDFTEPFIITKIEENNEYTNKGYWSIKTQRMDVSSTLVRNMIYNGMNPYPYVNQNILQIIKKYNLYTNGSKSF